MGWEVRGGGQGNEGKGGQDSARMRGGTRQRNERSTGWEERWKEKKTREREARKG